MYLETLFWIIVILAAGAAALFLIIRPSLPSLHHPAELVIPLADIAPIWTRHNVAVLPQKGPQEGNPQADLLDELFGDDSSDQAGVSMSETDEQQQEVVSLEQEPQGQPEPDPVQPPAPEPAATAPAKKPKPAKPAVPDMAPPLPVAAEPAPPAGEFSLSALAQPLKSLWDDCIAPYRPFIKTQGADKVIMELIRLLEKHGHCSSIVIDYADDESRDLMSVRDNLAHTTLRDHTYAVCRNMVAIVKKSIMDADNRIPSALIMALGHDIGKIPEYRLSGAYNAKDHARVGSFKLAEMMAGMNAFWVNKVITAVRDHHSPTKDDLANMLRMADRQARQNELSAHTRTYRIKPFEEWFDLKTFLTKYIEPGINVTQKDKWTAFSFSGSIYVMPDWIWDQAKQMCLDNSILDLNFVYKTEKDNSIRRIVSVMRKENMTPLLGDNYYARKFEIRTCREITKLKPLFLTVFTAPEYMNLAAIESRKRDLFTIIEAVKPQG